MAPQQERKAKFPLFFTGSKGILFYGAGSHFGGLCHSLFSGVNQEYLKKIKMVLSYRQYFFRGSLYCQHSAKHYPIRLTVRFYAVLRSVMNLRGKIFTKNTPA